MTWVHTWGNTDESTVRTECVLAVNFSETMVVFVYFIFNILLLHWCFHFVRLYNFCHVELFDICG